MDKMSHIGSSEQQFIEHYGIYAKNADELVALMKEKSVVQEYHQQVIEIIGNPLHPITQAAVSQALGKSGYEFLKTYGRIVAHDQDIQIKGKKPYNEFNEFLAQATAKDSAFNKFTANLGQQEFLFRVLKNPALPICIQAAKGVPYDEVITVIDVDQVVSLLDKTGYGVIDDGDGPAYAGDVYHLRNWADTCTYLRDHVDRVLATLDLQVSEEARGKLAQVEYTEPMYPLTRAIGGWESCCAIFGANGFEKYTDSNGKDHVRIEGLSEEQSDKLLLYVADEKNEKVQVDFSNMTADELKPGFVSNTQTFKQQGISSSLGTSSRSGGIIWNAIGLGDLLDAKADGRLLRQHDLAGKPEAPLFLLGCLRLGKHPSRCAVVEDAPKGIAAGNRGAFATIGIEIEGSFTQEKEVQFIDGNKTDVPKDYIRNLPIVSTVGDYQKNQQRYDTDQRNPHAGFLISDDVPDVLVSDFADITPELVIAVVAHLQSKFEEKGGEKPLRDLLGTLLGKWFTT
jgi:beta-phosphoglucomutase-like phosphatase (HAD superfamily)